MKKFQIFKPITSYQIIQYQSLQQDSLIFKNIKPFNQEVISIWQLKNLK